MFDKCKWEIYVTLFNLLQYEPLFLLQLFKGWSFYETFSKVLFIN